MIAILTVNYNSNNFIELMLSTIKDTPVVIVENSKIPQKIKSKHHLIHNPGEPSHGEGLNLGLQYIETDFVLILDSDCHLLTPDWKQYFLNKKCDCICPAGSPQKPIRPACVFMNTELARKLDWRATPGYQGHRITPDGFDVGIQAYHQMVKEDKTFYFMETNKNNRYGTLNGEEYGIDGKPIIYHHWFGSHVSSMIKDYPDHDLIADQKKLFDHFKRRTFL